jgi:hypothetical protein
MEQLFHSIDLFVSAKSGVWSDSPAITLIATEASDCFQMALWTFPYERSLIMSSNVKHAPLRI